MYIEVYVDILFLICLVPELLSLWLLGCLEHSWEEGRYRRFDNRKIRKIWIFWHLLWISSLFAGLSVTAAILLRQIGFWGLLAVDFLLQLFAFRLLFGRQSLSRKVTLWGLQKLFFLVLGGLFEAGWKRGRISAGSLFAGFIGGGVFFYAFLRFLQRKKQLERLLYSAELYWQGKSCRCLALLDTGNQLYYGTSPVLLLSPELAEELNFCWQEPTEDYRLIPYTSVGCPSGLLHGFVCDRIVIWAAKEPGREKIASYEQVVVGVAERPLSGTGEYQMLLHPALL